MIAPSMCVVHIQMIPHNQLDSVKQHEDESRREHEHRIVKPETEINMNQQHTTIHKQHTHTQHTNQTTQTQMDHMHTLKGAIVNEIDWWVTTRHVDFHLSCVVIVVCLTC